MIWEEEGGGGGGVGDDVFQAAKVELSHVVCIHRKHQSQTINLVLGFLSVLLSCPANNPSTLTI